MIHKHLIQTIVWLCVVITQTVNSQAAEPSQFSTPSLQSFGQQRPDDISDEKWLALKAAAQDIKLLPTPAGIGALQSYFGRSISIDNNRALVGAPGFDLHGAVYVLDFMGGNWQQTAVLVADDIAQFDSFGFSVSLDGNRALIGANRDDDNGNDSGSAYVFDFIGGSWAQSAKLTANDGMTDDEFGYSLSLYGNRVLIGSYKDDNTNGIDAGSVYVFDLNASNWSQTVKLIASNALDKNFSQSLGSSQNRILIGSSTNDDSGAAYIFDLISNSWQETIRLVASDASPGVSFGLSVSLDNDRVLIGARYDGASTGSAGSAYIFDLVGNNWMQTAKLIATDAQPLDNFGKTVSLSGDRALIGSFNHTLDLGSAYVFDLIASSWTQTIQLNASDGFTNDFFGASGISLFGDRIFIGASGDNDNDSNSGSVYTFDFAANTWSETTKILAEIDSAYNDFFGASVSLLGNRALIGAPNDTLENSNSTGSAYIFDWVAGSWKLSQKLLPDGVAVSNFGSSVSLSNNRALIGTNGAFYIFDLENGIWSRSTIVSLGAESGFGSAVSLLNNLALVGAKLDDQAGENAGAVYIYEFDFQNWSLIEKLMPLEIGVGDRFGSSISLSVSGFQALIGAPLDDDNGIDAGAAYVFNVGNGLASLEAKLTSSLFGAGDGDRFGTSVSLNGTVALIGANGDDELGTNAGAAYIFGYDSFSNTWLQYSKLRAVDGVAGDLFGTAVSLSDNRALISAIFDDDGGIDTGSAYVFKLNGFQQIDKFTANKRFDTGFFGISVALSGDRFLIGASLHDDNGSNSGAAYIFDDGLIYRDGFE